MVKGSTAVLMSCLLLGCSTVTQQQTNTLPNPEPNISPTLEQAQYKGLKRKVAIARFSNETNAGASLLLDSKDDRIGKQASDILAARLTETEKFILLERQDLGRIQDEASLQGMAVDTVGADYLIIGSVSEYGREAVSETGIFSRNKKQLARVKVNVRLVDVATGQVIYSEEGAGQAYSEANKVFGVGESAGYDTTLDDKALSAAISKLISDLVENLMDKPWQAYLLAQDNGLYLMTGGESQGVKIGDSFAVMLPGKMIKNPQTGMKMELPRTELAQLTVVSQSGNGLNEISYAKLSGGSLGNHKIEDLVVQESRN